ncbi:MAG: hypothetical protein LUB83_03620 [Prevotellaceae bacterium]|nr:hypothetical protein [Prevotellaceae bacterium]
MSRSLRISRLLLLSGLWLAAPLLAQNTTNLPTSMYGVGELCANEGGRYAGMGNVGIGLNRVGFQNTLNPAAITRMDTLCFTFDIGVGGSYSYYSFLGDHSYDFTANPNRLSVGFRSLRHWYTMLGVAPYSSVGYTIRTQEDIAGMPNTFATSLFEGSGGLYRVYLTNAFELSRRLSVGFNVGMIFGTITQSETQESAVVKYQNANRAVYGDVGVHYEFYSAGQNHFSIGAMFSPSLGMEHRNRLTYSNTSTSETVNKKYHSHEQYMPMHIGVGLSAITWHWVLAADYNYLDWSKNASSYTSMLYENQHKVSLGATYITEPRMPRSRELMAGLGYSNSYIDLKGGKMNYLEANVGASFPIRYSFLSVAAGYRKQINSRKNLMQEDRITLNVNFTFGERISRAKLR